MARRLVAVLAVVLTAGSLAAIAGPSVAQSNAPGALPTPLNSHCLVTPSPGASPVPPSPFTGNPDRTPPPTPVPPYGCPSPFPTSLVTPAPSASPPPISAAAAVLENARTGQVLYRRNGGAERPIASLTKLMTVQLALRHEALDTPVTVRRAAAAQPPSGMGLRVGETDTVRDLLYGVFLSSANDAAVALAQQVAGSVPAFVRMMNRRARALGMRRTHFDSPSGLNDNGVSTALDVARMARVTFGYPVVRRIARTKFETLPGPEGPRTLQNRNVLLWLFGGTVGLKTGYTYRSGWCLVAVAQRGGRRLLAVVLGDVNQAASFDDAAALLSYGFDEFVNRTVAESGQSLGAVTMQGRRVPVVTTAPVRLLLPAGEVGHTRWRLSPLPGVRLPVSPGQTVAVARLTARGGVLDRIRVAAAVFVAAPPPPPGAYLRPFARPARSWAQVQRDSLRLLGGVLRATYEAFL